MNDAAAQPLIPSSRDQPHDQRHSEDDETERAEIDESALVSPGWFIWTLTVCAGVSGLLFGYEYVTLCYTGRKTGTGSVADKVVL